MVKGFVLFAQSIAPIKYSFNPLRSTLGVEIHKIECAVKKMEIYYAFNKII